MRIPLFDPSALAELRASWRTRDEQAGRRLILETHRQRLRLLELRNLSDSGPVWRTARWVERGEPLMTLRIKIAHEVSRVDDIDDTQQMRRAEQEKLAIQTRSQMDYAREGRLRRHRRNI